MILGFITKEEAQSNEFKEILNSFEDQKGFA